MGFEEPKKGPPVEESLEDMKRESAEVIAELEAKYPTVESIVDDYRLAQISLGAVTMRFPDKADQDEVVRLANERNDAEGIERVKP